MARPKSSKAVQYYLENERKEWDFASISGFQKPMAVAWEYGRQLVQLHGLRAILPADPTLKADNKKAKLSRCFQSSYLDQIYCRFRVLKLWPKTPFLQLTYPDVRHAFRAAPWPKPNEEEATDWKKSIYFSPSDVLDPLFVEGNEGEGVNKDFLQMLIPPVLTDLAPTGIFNKESQERLNGALGLPGPNGLRMHPAMRLLLIDIERHPWELENAFRDFLQKHKKLLPRGRSDYEKDLSALTIFRLNRFFGSLEKMEKAIKTHIWSKPNKSSDLKKYKRESIVGKELWNEYLSHAKYRLGLEPCPHQEPDPRFVGPVFDISRPL